MRVVSMDEASNLFRACFCHGDASFATATRLFKGTLLKIDSTENRVRSTPNEIARFKLPSSKFLYTHTSVLHRSMICQCAHS